MMSLHNSMHSSQMHAPASPVMISFTSLFDLLQKLHQCVAFGVFSNPTVNADLAP